MKIKVVLIFIVFVSTINGFAQKQKDKLLFTFCETSGDCTMSLKEFKNCKKELVPVDANLKITSFKVSLFVMDENKRDGAYIDYLNSGNTFSAETIDAIEKFSSEKRLEGKILIGSVEVSQDGKKWKTSGMIIRLR